MHPLSQTHHRATTCTHIPDVGFHERFILTSFGLALLLLDLQTRLYLSPPQRPSSHVRRSHHHLVQSFFRYLTLVQQLLLSKVVLKVLQEDLLTLSYP